MFLSSVREETNAGVLIDMCAGREQYMKSVGKQKMLVKQECEGGNFMAGR